MSRDPIERGPAGIYVMLGNSCVGAVDMLGLEKYEGPYRVEKGTVKYREMVALPAAGATQHASLDIKSAPDSILKCRKDSEWGAVFSLPDYSAVIYIREEFWADSSVLAHEEEHVSIYREARESTERLLRLYNGHCRCIPCDVAYFAWVKAGAAVWANRHDQKDGHLDCSGGLTHGCAREAKAVLLEPILSADTEKAYWEMVRVCVK
jgi:hypothetical protein